jgi:PAS domain S-box-containing protein
MQRALPYGLGVAAVGAALLLSMLPVWCPRYPFLLFYPCVALAAWYGGLVPGLVATGLSTAILWLAMEPLGLLVPQGPWDLVGWGVFVAVNVFISGLSEGLHRARRRAEAARDEARARAADAQAFFEAASVGTAEADLDGRFIIVNAQFCEITGYTRDELRGMSFIDVTHPDDRDATRQAAAAFVAGNAREYRLEKRYLRKDGNIVWVDVNAAPVRDPAGRLLYTVGVIQDITARRRYQEDLEKSEQLFRSLVSASAQVVWRADADGSVIEDSPTWRAYTGQTFEEYRGLGWMDAIHPDDRERVRIDVLAALEGRQRFESEYRLRRSDGSWSWTVARATAILGRGGALQGWIGTNTDITDRKAADEALRASEARLHAALEVGGIGIWELDLSRGLGYWSPMAFAVIGIDPQATALDQGIWRALVHPDDSGAVEAEFKRARDARDEYRCEHRVVRPDGVVRWLDARGRFFYDEKGTPVRMLGALVDVTNRKMAETEREELLGIAERARAEAEAGSRAKDEFLAMLGHELRNPLAAVRNAVVTAQLDSARRERSLEIARGQTDQLVRLLDDLLDVARITQGRITLRREPTYLAGIVARVLETTRAVVEERGHTLDVRLPADDVRIDADSARIEQVLVNLVTNAAKYTEPGGSIRIELRRDGTDAVLAVRDSGIGIAPDMLPRVFDLFAQAERGLDRAQGGLGIGLTIVKRVVELHGGRVEARSDGVGRGAEFVVRLPALPAAPEETAAAPVESSPRKGARARVLVVEDNPATAETLVMLLELLGHEVHVAHDGRAALELARATTPRVLLVDIGLPGMNGYEVARRAREDPQLRDAVLFALSGYGRDEDRAAALAAGFDGHLVKPVSAEVLEELVARSASRAH